MSDVYALICDYCEVIEDYLVHGRELDKDPYGSYDYHIQPIKFIKDVPKFILQKNLILGYCYYKGNPDTVIFIDVKYKFNMVLVSKNIVFIDYENNIVTELLKITSLE